MGWSNMNEETEKKGTDLSSKILIAIIGCLLLIIVLIFVLLINIQQTTYTISVDGKEFTNINKTSLLATIDEITYVNIEEFAKLVGYEYHEGEYKAFTIEKNKCYVQGKNETATFYLNDNKVCKLPVNKLTEDYKEFTIENTIKSKDDKMYVPIEAVNLAFNVVLDEASDYFKVYTLDYLVASYDTKVKQWGYTGIAEQSFENQKSILYGYLIVKKEGGLYKIIDSDNTKEIVSDKYNAIEFTENTKEFFVTNSLEQVGIINLDGTTKIDPIYNSISVLNKKSDLYLIQKDSKYGVVKSGNVTIVFPEYDSIGLNNNITTDSQYLILDTLIPVCKNNKWGAFDKTTGKLVYQLEYDGFGCNITTVEVDEVKKAVSPVLSIERCKGVVVKKENKYGILDLSGKELVPIAVDSIYQIENVEDEDKRYFMVYNKEELNIIERLIKAGILEGTIQEEIKNEETNNTVTNNTIDNNVISNSADNNTENTISTSANASMNNVITITQDNDENIITNIN